MAILLLRHGQTADNQSGHERLRLKTSQLTPEGRQSAVDAALLVKDLPVPYIVSSDLPRGVETAHIWGHLAGKPVESSQLLRARNMGVLEGHSVKDATPALDAMAAQPDLAPKGGESINTFVNRVWTALKPLVESDKLIGVVGHGSIAKALEMKLSGAPATVWNKLPIIPPGGLAVVTRNGVERLDAGEKTAAGSMGAS